MSSTEKISDDIEEEILELEKVKRAENDFAKIDGNWYGSTAFEFRSKDPVDMVELFTKERGSDVVYYKSGAKIGEEKYQIYFIVKSEDSLLKKRRVGAFADFEHEVRKKADELESIPEVNDGYIFEEDEDGLEDFILSSKEKLVEPDVPVPLHYVTPDSIIENSDGEKVVEGVAIESDIYVRDQNGRIYELIK
jgi:hypothetical protein